MPESEKIDLLVNGEKVAEVSEAEMPATLDLLTKTVAALGFTAADQPAVIDAPEGKAIYHVFARYDAPELEEILITTFQRQKPDADATQ